MKPVALLLACAACSTTPGAPTPSSGGTTGGTASTTGGGSSSGGGTGGGGTGTPTALAGALAFPVAWGGDSPIRNDLPDGGGQFLDPTTLEIDLVDTAPPGGVETCDGGQFFPYTNSIVMQLYARAPLTAPASFPLIARSLADGGNNGALLVTTGAMGGVPIAFAVGGQASIDTLDATGASGTFTAELRSGDGGTSQLSRHFATVTMCAHD